MPTTSGGAGAVDPVKLLSNAKTRALLAALSRGPSYPRELARLLSLTEGEVQRKLHRLERAGLVTGAWRSRARKTVKEYSLRAAGVAFDFASGTPTLVPSSTAASARIG